MCCIKGIIVKSADAANAWCATPIIELWEARRRCVLYITAGAASMASAASMAGVASIAVSLLNTGRCGRWVVYTDRGAAPSPDPTLSNFFLQDNINASPTITTGQRWC